MAHFAKLDENNIVTEVLVVNNEVVTINGLETEQIGIDFLSGLFDHPYWKQTSYNGKFRKNYAGIGWTYDQTRDAFIPPKPEGNYVLNEDACLWERAPELGIVSGDPLITADGVDFVTVYIAGAVANSTQVVMINGETINVDTDMEGKGYFELSSETTGSIIVVWGSIELEIIAYDI